MNDWLFSDTAVRVVLVIQLLCIVTLAACVVLLWPWGMVFGLFVPVGVRNAVTFRRFLKDS